MNNLLNEIFTNKKKELEEVKKGKPLEELKRALSDAEPARDFKSAILKSGSSIIAEIKFSSPSYRGKKFRDRAIIKDIAGAYSDGGAAAISVLTEKIYFSGDINDLREVRGAVDIPILRKDFIFDPYQVYEAGAFGADAFLLIADYLERGLLENLLQTGEEVGIHPLVEVHSEESLKKVAGLSFCLLGINNRDLKRLETDINITFSLLAKYGNDLKAKAIISESGIETREEIVRLEQAGVKGFLIGTALMKSGEPREKLKTLIGD